jgi:uncharacterized C2H2 Zn-finger protein
LTAQPENEIPKHFLKCPHCPCIFLTQTDLQKHLSCMGNNKEEHADVYQRTHGRIEHGGGNAE